MALKKWVTKENIENKSHQQIHKEFKDTEILLGNPKVISYITSVIKAINKKERL